MQVRTTLEKGYVGESLRWGKDYVIQRLCYRKSTLGEVYVIGSLCCGKTTLEKDYVVRWGKTTLGEE